MGSYLLLSLDVLLFELCDLGVLSVDGTEGLGQFLFGFQESDIVSVIGCIIDTVGLGEDMTLTFILHLRGGHFPFIIRVLGLWFLENLFILLLDLEQVHNEIY